VFGFSPIAVPAHMIDRRNAANMFLVNRLNVVTQDLTLDEYRELAEFRYQIRCFQSVSEEHARDLGIDLDSWLLLLVVQGLPEGVQPTITGLADRMCLPKEAVNRLIDQSVTRGDLTRASSDIGGSADWVKLTRNGRELLRRMSMANRDELERTGPELVRSLNAVLKQRRRKSRGVA
jgi:DNA-binding MarR family transcriptional regulator